MTQNIDREREAQAVALPSARGALDDLRSRVRGPVLVACDPGFDEATRLWNGAVDKAPAIVVQPVGADDVAHAVVFARDHGLAVAVRGGGHNVAGTALADGGMTIDLGAWRDVVVDPAARTVTAQAGCRLGDVDRAAQEHGLATPLGFFSEVGLAGLTLGGGLGYLTRRFGWTVDNLLEVEIVTADGRVLHAGADERPDLFWAMRGAGANLGVVTSFTLRVHPVGPTVLGGLIAWPFERAAEILPAYRELTATAPRELAVWMNLLRAPAAPFVPEAWQGERICAMAVCYSGDLRRAEDALAPLRALGAPVFDLLHEQPYVQVQSYLDATEPKGRHYYWKTEYLAGLDDELLSTWRDLGAQCPIPDAQLGLLHIGGALNDRAGDDGVVGNRDARYVIGVIGGWEPHAPGCEGFPGWVRAAWERIRPFSTGGNYINFQSADESEDRIAASYGANLGRLRAIKREYDPGNVFRSNRNVTP
ncbi:MAG: FAD-binding oxidoreductase [Solirubrobacterales bacterium]|nr:FAD-binding oxidoreductase [Solirubrobacterales bacterium]